MFIVEASFKILIAVLKYCDMYIIQTPMGVIFELEMS